MQRLLTKQFRNVNSWLLCSLFQAPAFMASPNRFVSGHRGSRYWSSPSSPSTWPTGPFADQLARALWPHTASAGYRRNTPEAQTHYAFTPRLSWSRLCKPQGAAREVQLLNTIKYQRSHLQHCSETLELRAVHIPVWASPCNFIWELG